MEQNIEKQNTKRRSTFAVLFYINRTKIRKDGMCQLLCKVSIDAAQINNRNAGLTTHEVNTGSTSVTEYQGSGAATRYLAGTSGVYIYEDESDHLHTPEGNYSSWLAYRYTRTTTETQVLTSAPGEILSGGAMTLGADAVLNDDSRIVAGGNPPEVFYYTADHYSSFRQIEPLP